MLLNVHVQLCPRSYTYEKNMSLAYCDFPNGFLALLSTNNSLECFFLPMEEEQKR